MMISYLIYIYIWGIKLFYPQFWRISTSLIYAQARLESGNFKSAITKENKNVFGMKQARKRKNTAIGTNRGHAVYSTYFNGVRDYFYRQSYFKINGESTQAYTKSTVKSGYAEDKGYLEKWRELHTSLGVIEKNLIYIIVGVLIVLICLIYGSKYIRNVL